MSAYYNEFDPKAAAWLRELIADGHIPPGEVDERDIRDVRPDELRPFRQCHFFAGIGGWALALRLAGWPDDRPVWSASCPCQPFSAAGGRGGFADERHLWPAFYHLASQCCPDVVFGEQSSSKDGLAWFDLVSSDMEAAAYSGGALDLCSAGFGAPNIRQRLYFVWLADAVRDGAEPVAGDGGRQEAKDGGPLRRLARRQLTAGNDGASRRLADTGRQRSAERRGLRDMGSSAPCDEAARGERQRLRDAADDRGATGGLADTDGWHPRPERLQRGGQHGQRAQDAGDSGGCFPGALKGFWRDADWVLCRDPDGPAWRPTQPGSFPLAPSIPGRMALIRGAGNAINVEVARGFIETVMEVAP